jgi:hypothetical protein
VRKNFLEDLGVDGRIILKWTFKKKDVSVKWIDLAQDRNMWRALLKIVMNLSRRKWRTVECPRE